MRKIKVAIVGYGNIGKGVQKALAKNPDMRLVVILTRRPEDVKKEVGDVPVVGMTSYGLDVLPSRLRKTGIDIDVAILCGGSKKDLPAQGPLLAGRFNVVDSFDTHAKIPDYSQEVDSRAREGKKVAVFSAGWDPGIFSLMRVLFDAVLPESSTYTFWGPGVSQGHSDAARKVEGVLDARQYTLPIEEAIAKVRAGENPKFTKREMHRRLVYVVPKPGADLEKIRQDITSMPDYFADYDTRVEFTISEAVAGEHSSFPHGGFVFASGLTGENNKQLLEFQCKLESNPEFTGSILVACARAAVRLNQEGYIGAFTMLDFPVSYLSPHPTETLRGKFM